MRFDGKMVKKPWGVEYCAYDDGNVAIWYLHIRQGQRTSRHMHLKKATSLQLMAGVARVSIGTMGEMSLEADPLAIMRGVPHATSAVTDSWVVEIETPSDKLDLVRIEDAYGRNGKPYENGENIIDFDQRYAYPATEFPA